MERTTRGPARDDDVTPTIKDVAARARVSIATVSRVLAGRDGVNPELVRRVRTAARTLDYHPNRNASNLRSGKTRTIGVVIPNIENPFFTSVVRGIENALRGAGYTLLLGDADEDPAREQLYLATLRAEGVAGVILAPVDDHPGRYEEHLRARVPLVAIDLSPGDPSVDLVTAANAPGARAAVRHLLGLGHTRIGLVSGPVHFSTAQERRAGYEQAMDEAGVPRPADLVQVGVFRETGGHAAMRTLLELPVPPTAVFVANNLMALGAIKAIHERGLRIPEDVAVVGFDDMPWADSLQPPLTVVAQPTYELGATAAHLLLARLREPDRPVRRIVLETTLVVRSSCGAKRPVGAR